MNDFQDLFEFMNSKYLNDRKGTDPESKAHFVMRDFFLDLPTNIKLSSKRSGQKFEFELKKTIFDSKYEIKNGKLVCLLQPSKNKKNQGWRKHFLSATQLLTHIHSSRIKKCANNDCPHLFLDQSKNCSRKWCDMNHCGMLSKSRRFYNKHRRKRSISTGK